MQFKPGATFTVLKGAVKGYDTASYSLEAKNGQVMHMLFKPSNRFCYFSVGERARTASSMTARWTATSSARISRPTEASGSTCS